MPITFCIINPLPGIIITSTAELVNEQRSQQLVKTETGVEAATAKNGRSTRILMTFVTIDQPTSCTRIVAMEPTRLTPALRPT